MDISTVVNDDLTMTIKLNQWLTPAVAAVLDGGIVTGTIKDFNGQLHMEFTVAPKKRLCLSSRFLRLSTKAASSVHGDAT